MIKKFILYVFILLFSVTQKAQSLYWVTGAVMYMTPCILFFFRLSVLLQQYSKPVKEIGVITLSSLLAWLLVGTNEVSALIFSALSFGFLLLGYVYELNKYRMRLFINFIASFIGFLLVYLGPGNTVRIHAARPDERLYDLAFSLTLEMAGKYNKAKVSSEFRKRVIEMDLLAKIGLDIQDMLQGGKDVGSSRK